MPAIELLSYFLGENPKSLSKEEKKMLEADLWFCICNELKEIFRERYQSYFQLMNFTKEMEDAMIDGNYIKWVVEDLLLTENYTMSGLAYYTHTPEEIIYEIVMGRNLRPTAIFLHRIIELHREVKRELYNSIRKKIIDEYLLVA